MPTERDKGFARTLLEVAITLDGLCETLRETADSRAEEIIDKLRDLEFDINELREDVA